MYCGGLLVLLVNVCYVYNMITIIRILYVYGYMLLLFLRNCCTILGTMPFVLSLYPDHVCSFIH